MTLEQGTTAKARLTQTISCRSGKWKSFPCLHLFSECSLILPSQGLSVEQSC